MELDTQSKLCRFVCMQLLVASVVCLSPGCSTAPKQTDQAKVIADSRSATRWFRNNVRGLSAQLDNSAGYASYPGVGQYGLLISGGKFGRGVVYDSNHRQVGWAYINVVSAGLQVGVQGYKMLVVFEDPATMRRFQQNKLTGNVGVTIVALRAERAEPPRHSSPTASRSTRGPGRAHGRGQRRVRLHAL